MTDWGDIATWVGSIVAAVAVLWAVIVYIVGFFDRRKAQARLLSIARPPVQIQVRPGTVTNTTPDVFLAGKPIGRPRRDGEGVDIITTEKSTVVHFHLISTSDEPFTVTAIDIIRKDGTALSFPNYWPDVAPRAEFKLAVYYPPEVLGATESYRVRFRDANGRQWERVNGEPVRKYKPKRKND